jgi:hypothetical protein
VAKRQRLSPDQRVAIHHGFLLPLDKPEQR